MAMASTRHLLRLGRRLLPSQPPKTCSSICSFASLSSPSFPASLAPPLHSFPETPSSIPFLCGRGDKKTKKGKRFKGTFGNYRPDREHRIRRIKERWEQPPNTPWPVPGLSIEEYLPV